MLAETVGASIEAPAFSASISIWPSSIRKKCRVRGSRTSRSATAAEDRGADEERVLRAAFTWLRCKHVEPSRGAHLRSEPPGRHSNGNQSSDREWAETHVTEPAARSTSVARVVPHGVSAVPLVESNLGRIDEAARAHGPDSEEVARRVKRLFMIFRFDTALLILIVLDMSAKPFA